MTAASRVQPDQYFTPQEWQGLSAKSSWRGLALVVHCWISIGVAMWCGWRWPSCVPLMVLFIGNRQLGLFILMHDAAHGLLHPNRKLNDWVARCFCGNELDAYRPYHLQHHRYVQQSEDPDLVLSAPFPISRASLLRKITRDLTGQTFFKQRLDGLVQRLRERTAAQRLEPAQSAWRIVGRELFRQRVFLLSNGIGLAVFGVAGVAWVWLLMWLLPMATWLPLVSRLRNISEHALIAQNGTNPLRHARTTHANWVERLLIAPYWVNFHCEHHMFTQVACWNLPKAHRLLASKGVTQDMQLQSGYLSMLRQAAPLTGAVV